jgi:hypothetical protein
MLFRRPAEAVNYLDDMPQPTEAAPRPRTPLEPAAWLALALLSAVWAWWAAKEGAWFGVVMLPGAIVLCIGMALLVRFGPWRAQLSLSPPVVVVLGGLLGLAGWTLLSLLWTPSPDVAVTDAQKLAVYALAFALGLVLCNFLGKRMGLSLVPLAVAGGIAGLIGAASLATGSSPRDLLEVDGTLDFPLGYRNANAAFFAIALFPAVGLAADRMADARVRAGALAAATACLNMFILSQSRGSVPALAIALVVYVLASPQRVRAISWLALALLPALAVVPAMTELYAAAPDGLSGTVDEMNGAGMIALASTLGGLILGGLAVALEARLPGLGSRSDAGNRVVARGLLGLAVVAAVAFVVAVGNPIDWLTSRADEFRNSPSPNLSEQSTRFSFNAGSERYDAWRVALEDAGADPVFGDGAGGYTYSYTRNRENEGQVLHDAHSVELEILSELGVIGLLLLAAVLVGIVAGIVRARRLGPSAAALGAIALASFTYWLVHASVDWFWPYPALTAPVLALAGSACAPAVRTVGRRSTRRWRGWLTAALAVLAISAIPLWLAERFVDNAYSGWRSDLAGAYDDLDRAQRLNPLSDMPVLAEGAIAKAAGDADRALEAFGEAADMRPEEWATHYLLADLHADSDRLVARNEIRVALELNPLDQRVRELAEELGVDPETGALISR